MNWPDIPIAVAHILTEELPPLFLNNPDTVPVETHLDDFTIEVMIQIKGRNKNIAYLDIDDTVEVWPLYQEKATSYNQPTPNSRRNNRLKPYAKVEFSNPDMVSETATRIQELLAVFIADFRAQYPHLDPQDWQHGRGKPPSST